MNKLPLVAASILVLILGAFSTEAQECSQGGAEWPAGQDPITGQLDCTGTCASSSCGPVLEAIAPGVILAYFGCGGEEPGCCHLTVIADTGNGDVSFGATGECSTNCPGPDGPCGVVFITTIVEGVIVKEAVAPICRN